ncbi:MAG: DUF3726 domain-containing protein [Amylibacter sp.]
MIPSLSEVTATGRKAAKGAGYSWGLADEAGRTTAWLWEHGIDGITALADLLDAGSPETCPIYIGTGLCDAPSSDPVTFENVHSPILLLSFAAELSKITKDSYQLTFAEGVFSTTPEAMFCACPATNTQASITLRRDPVSGEQLGPVPRREAPAQAWARLGAWEHKTYAPATEASRLAGAGADLSDND